MANLVSSDNRGLAFGWYNFAIGIVALPAHLIFGKLYDAFGACTSFAWGPSCALAASVLLAATRPRATQAS